MLLSQILERLHLGPLGPRATVQVEHQIGEANSLQARHDSVDSGAFLGDKQHALASSDEDGDQVGDGLQLLPVPGGPSMIRLRPATAALMAAFWVLSASCVRNSSAGGM